MDHSEPSRYYEGGVAELFLAADDHRLRIIANALRDYAKNNKTSKQFEEDYGCKLIVKDGVDISGIKFQSAGNETAFMLKYNK